MKANRRTDDELDAILREVGYWVINGQSQALSFAASLHSALDQARALSSSGAIVTGLARLPFDEIVVPPDQITRLRKLIAGRELPVLRLDDNRKKSAA